MQHQSSINPANLQFIFDDYFNAEVQKSQNKTLQPPEPKMAGEDIQQLISLILQFLSTSVQDGSIPSDKRERVGVASESIALFPGSYSRFLSVQYITKAFCVNPADAHRESNIEPANLQSIFDGYFKTSQTAPVKSEVGSLNNHGLGCLTCFWS